MTSKECSVLHEVYQDVFARPWKEGLIGVVVPAQPQVSAPGCQVLPAWPVLQACMAVIPVRVAG